MLELFGGKHCPYTAEMREQLEWEGREFVEYDVESDELARKRLQTLMPDPATVPVLVAEGSVVEVGWHGRSCYVGGAS